MRYTPQIEKAILDQIEREPQREIVLPDWAYWKGIDQPWIYVDGRPQRLVRVLYETVIGVLPEGAGLTGRPGTHPRNINPHLFVVVPTLRARAACPNGHPYTEDDWTEGVGHRCQACRVSKLLGGLSASEKNKRKKVCPQGHKLVRRKNGRRRCYECPRIREQERRRRQKEMP